MDAIDQVLDGLKLQSSVFSRLELGPDHGFSKVAMEGAPFHIVLEGNAWVGLATSEELVHFTCGDMVILPRGQAHHLLCAPDVQVIPFKQVLDNLGIELWTRGARMKPKIVRMVGDGQPCTTLVSGIFEFTDRRRNPLLSALPDMLILRAAYEAGTSGGKLADIGSMISREIEANQPGSALVAGRLADYLFVQAVREHLVRNASDEPGWLKGLRNYSIGTALSLIHSRPDYGWSVSSLAREVSMSRSAFAELFRTCVGRGPIEYLTSWRMFEAAGHLNDGILSLKEIAKLAGYNSPAAFGVAFKRWCGESPARTKRHSRLAETPTERGRETTLENTIEA
jgi:AraC-like DNA-binding protein